MIQIKNLTKTIGKTAVLSKINLQIQRQDKIALIGHNGSGKTTLIRCLLGLYKFNGEIALDGIPSKQNREAMLKGIGFVPQTPPPLRMLLKDMVHLNNSMSETDVRESIFEICARMGLDLHASIGKSFMELSGGMKQKLLIALAIAKRPQFLILDEPVANIDLEGQRQFLEEVGGLTQNTALLICSHRLEEVLPLVNRVVSMRKGEIVSDESLATGGSAAFKTYSLRLTNQPSPALSVILRQWNFRHTGDNSYSAAVLASSEATLTASLSKFQNCIATISED